MNQTVVLLVEDEALILLEVEARLVEAGFEVVGVGNASQALVNFDAEPERFRALVTDIRLGRDRPAGMSLAMCARPCHRCR